MKVCILSMQRVPNFGSVLQGYSLKKMIESLGHEVDFIDIKENNEENNMLVQQKKSFAFEYGNKEKKFYEKFDKYFLNRIRTKRPNKKQIVLMNEFQKQIIDLQQENNDKKYDCCVIGSDEVFNALNDSEWGFTSQLFGNVSNAEKVVTYAASCGFTTYEDLPNAVRKVISDSFKNVSSFSVRDDNTYNFVKKITGKNILMHLDPVVVGDFSKESENAPRICNLPKRYCLIYAYHNRINNTEEIAEIKKLCKKENMTIITVGSSQSWVGKHMAISPFQIPEIFGEAQFVITDTFHGTIFSAKYSKKFAVLVRPSNENKLGDLINRLQINKHRIDRIEDLQQIYDVEHNLQEMRYLEQEERQRTIDYLGNAITLD